MSTYTEEMLSLWEFEWASFGTTATYNSASFRCIKDPVKKGFVMTPNAMDGKSQTVIDMLRTDAIANGLYDLMQKNPQTKRPIVTIGGNTYTLNQIESDDDAQPSVRYSAFLEQ